MLSQLCQRLSVPNNAIAYPIIAHQCRCFSTLHNAFAIPGPSFLCHRSRWSMHCPRRTNHIESTPSLNYAVPMPIVSKLFIALATHGLAMPLLYFTFLCRRISRLRHAFADRCASLHGHANAIPVYAFPAPILASPCRRDTLHTHASPVPSYAFPMQYTASPSQNNASLFLCDANHIGSYLRHR